MAFLANLAEASGIASQWKNDREDASLAITGTIVNGDLITRALDGNSGVISFG